MSPRSVSPLPVYLLTGFLGSGKTTLLSRLVRQPEFADTAVIVNEFGAVALDHVLIDESGGDDVVVLDSGCLCCASSSPLQDSLESLYFRRLRGEVPAFARVMVETSGLADPLPLINALHADPSVARHYSFAGVVTTVDAVNGADSLERYRECMLQLAVADRVVLTKTDLVTPAEAAAAELLVRRANPQADVLVAPPPDSEAAPDVLKGLVRHAIHRSHALANGAGASPSTTPFAHLLRYGIASHVLRLDRPVAWSEYAEWVQTLQRTLGERLLRAKGIVTFEDGQTYAVHGVRHLFAPPQLMTGVVPDAQRGSIVLITSNADAQEIARASAALLPDIGCDPPQVNPRSSLSNST
jgi:G3E family GTPase